MRIAVLSPTAISTPPPNLGYAGIELLAWWLVEELEKLDHQVTLFASEGSLSPQKGSLITAKSESEVAEKCASRAKDKDFDIVHDWTHFKPLSLYDLWHSLEGCSTVFYTDQIGRNPVFPTRVVAEAMAHGSSWKVIYPGVKTELYRFNQDREEWLLYFGRIASYKGVDTAIQVARKVGMPLKIAGHEGFFAEPEYAKMIKSMCTDGIEYLGEQSFEQKVDLFSRAKALVMPYRWLESFGIVVVEALLSGCPVICSEHGGPREIVQHGISGFVCSSYDEFVNAVKRVEEIYPKECRQRGLYFSSQRMGYEYVCYYEELLRRI